jgi:hypothetical protein
LSIAEISRKNWVSSNPYGFIYEFMIYQTHSNE